MATINNLTSDQTQTLLTKGFTDNELIFYLSQIRSHQPVSLEYGNEFIFISPQDAWNLIDTWVTDSGSNYSILERGSLTAKANHLTTSINSYKQTKRTAAAVQPALRTEISQEKLSDQPLNSFQRALADRSDFYQAYNDYLLNPTSNKIANLPYLKRIIPNDRIRNLVALQLVANWSNYLQPSDPALSSLPPAQAKEFARVSNLNETSQLLRYTHQQEKGPLIELIHSDEGQGQLSDVLDTIEQDVQSHYTKKGGEFNREKALHDASNFAQFTLLGGTLTNLTQNLRANGSLGLDPAELDRLNRALRQNIISASQNPNLHLSSQEIIDNTLDQFNASSHSRTTLSQELLKLSPQIETTQISLRNSFLENVLSESGNQRLIATSKLAREAGVSPETFWLKQSDLDRAQSLLLARHGATSIIEAISGEMNNPNSNPLHLNQLLDFQNKTEGYQSYMLARQDIPGFAFRDALAHASGTYRSIRQPYDNFTTKIWGKYDKIDSIINYPQRKIINFWQDAVDGKISFRDKVYNIPTVVRLGKTNIPLLNLPGFAIDQFIKFKKSIALGIFRFAKSGNRANNSFWGGIASYSKVFFKSDGNFAQTNFFMFSRAKGNVLNWASKKITNKSWQAVKASIGGKLWAGFSKAAPGLSKKFAGTAIQKIVTSLGFASISGGTALLIQAGFIVATTGLKNIWKFITNKGGFRTKAINLAPIIAGIAAIPALITSALGALALTISGAIGALATALASVPALIIAALGIAFGSVLVLLFFINTMIKTPWDIDSAPGRILTSIFCDESGEGDGSAASAAICIADILTKAGLNPLLASDVNSTLWQQIISALFPDTIKAIAKSASGQGAFQCVGLIAAGVTESGGAYWEPPNANQLDINSPPGYTYVSGVGSCQPGDAFVDMGGTYGHTGWIVEDAGAHFVCVDANMGSAGAVRNRDSCRYAKSKIDGCLKKI